MLLFFASFSFYAFFLIINQGIRPNNEKTRQKTIVVSKVLNTFAPEINEPR